MQTNNQKVVDYDAVLDAKFGKKGSQSRLEAEEKAFVFYTGQIIEQARKESKMSQATLAEKIGSSKSYVSRVESGKAEPKISTFYRMASTLGLAVELNPVP